MATQDNLNKQQFTTLHRGVGDYSANDYQGKPFKTAEDWQSEATEDFPNYGTWWSHNEGTAKFYSESRSDVRKTAFGVVVSAQFPKESVNEMGDESPEVRVPHGIEGNVTKVQAADYEKGWKELPHTPGMKITT